MCGLGLKVWIVVGGEDVILSEVWRWVGVWRNGGLL